MDDDERAQFLEGILDEAVAPYRKLVPREQLEAMRGALREELLADATAGRLLSAARPRAVPKRSGEVGVDEPKKGEEAAQGGQVVPLRKRQIG